MVLEAHRLYGNVSSEGWVRPVDHVQDRPIAFPDLVRASGTTPQLVGAFVAGGTIPGRWDLPADDHLLFGDVDSDFMTVSVPGRSAATTFPAPRP
ncbi:hypothetical protein FBY41_0008 [Humibacillus xanthopallidus]|uniref:Uncharacterized protein n=1 Tax=Humibacillus xanthopallidus TaxID=412689 RepID=A0A543HZD4_9MICO|nr:hypothetical protein FBY41_0008 [Humibacillus xanthopallidus]